jgi:hypothetical protein
MSERKKTLYERLGGYDAISAVANDLLSRLEAVSLRLEPRRAQVPGVTWVNLGLVALVEAKATAALTLFGVALGGFAIAVVMGHTEAMIAFWCALTTSAGAWRLLR